MLTFTRPQIFCPLKQGPNWLRENEAENKCQTNCPINLVTELGPLIFTRALLISWHPWYLQAVRTVRRPVKPFNRISKKTYVCSMNNTLCDHRPGYCWNLALGPGNRGVNSKKHMLAFQTLLSHIGSKVQCVVWWFKWEVNCTRAHVIQPGQVTRVQYNRVQRARVNSWTFYRTTRLL